MQVSVNDSGSMFVVTVDPAVSTADTVNRILSLPGAKKVGKNGEALRVEVPTSTPVCVALWDYFGAMHESSPKAIGMISDRYVQSSLKERLLAGDGEPTCLYDPGLSNKYRTLLPRIKRDLMPHQVKALDAITAMGFRALLADDMGLGKTTVALAAHARSKADKCLIVCPASVKYNWANEIEQAVGVMDPVLIDGTKQKRETAFAAIERVTPAYVIINYDLLIRLTEDQVEALQGYATGGTLILDESHYVKDAKAKRSKACKALAECAENVLLLTGTPVRNMVDDYYHQLTLIDYIWRSQWEFEDTYIVKREINLGGRKVFAPIGTKNEKQLQAVVNCYQIRRLKHEAVDLPPKMPPTIEGIELDAHSDKLYRAMKREWLYEFENIPGDTPILAKRCESAMLALLRCEQIAQGFVGGLHPDLAKKLGDKLSRYDVIKGRDGELFFPDNAKAKWLIERVRDFHTTPRPVVVWFKYNAPLFWFSERLEKEIEGCSTIKLHGGLSSEEKAEAIKSFQEGEANVFLAQVKMGEGFNLTRAQDAIFYGRDWSPAINSQAEDRIHRIGQTGTVNIYIPIAMGTIEAQIHARLREKADGAESVMKNLTVAELRGML